ncbi:MAG: hypothetical protein OXU21_04620 [Chloroflexota bacterium]|nr:hypothetical protein [Chloroflexota bacterium]
MAADLVVLTGNRGAGPAGWTLAGPGATNDKEIHYEATISHSDGPDGRRDLAGGDGRGQRGHRGVAMVSLGPLEVLIIILAALPIVALVVGTAAAMRYLYLSWRRPER